MIAETIESVIDMTDAHPETRKPTDQESSLQVADPGVPPMPTDHLAASSLPASDHDISTQRQRGQADASLTAWRKYARVLIRQRGPVFNWFVGLFLVLIGLAVTLAIYIFLVPRVWHWGLSSGSWWKITLTLIAEWFIVALGALPPAPGFVFVHETVEYYVSSSEDALKGINDAQSELEDKLVQQGDASITSVIRLSRLELEKWNTTSLSQNRRSYAYAVMAMWIGFTVITVGILLAFGVFHVRNQTSPIAINVVVLASGAVVEVVSGLFFWVYRSSLEYYAYFYDRQMMAYQALMAYNISSNMEDKDPPRLLIIQRLLEASERPTPSPLPRTTRSRANLGAAKSK